MIGSDGLYQIDFITGCISPESQIGLLTLVVGVFYELIDHKILEQTASEKVCGELLCGLYTQEGTGQPRIVKV